MSVAIAERLISPEEYLAAERVAEEKSEYYAGRVVPMAGALKRHNRLSRNVGYSFMKRLEESEFEVFFADMRVEAGEGDQYSYPDVVVASEHAEFDGYYVDGEYEEDVLVTPLVIVEVLSKSTESYDRGEKFNRYRLIETLRDYILVSQTEHRVEHHSRTNTGWQVIVHTDLRSNLRVQSLGIDILISEIYARVRVGPYSTRSRLR
jgi:Uma2 family endonuclease